MVVTTGSAEVGSDLVVDPSVSFFGRSLGVEAALMGYGTDQAAAPPNARNRSRPSARQRFTFVNDQPCFSWISE